MKLKRIFLFLLVASFIFLGACGSKGTQENDDITSGDDAGTIINEQLNRKIYYTVTLCIETKDLNALLKDINSKVSQLDGYVQESTQYENESSQEGVTIYKVPTDKLEEFLLYMDGKGGLSSKIIKSNDITSEYSQSEARLEVLKASRKAYVDILDGGSLSISEIIQINTRISEIDTEINYLENQMSQYDNLIEYSTITINFNQEQNNSIFTGYIDYLLKFITVIFTIFLYILPFGILGGIIVLISIIINRSSKRKKNKTIKE